MTINKMANSTNSDVSKPISVAAIKSDVNIMTVFEHQRLTSDHFLHPADFMWLITQEFAVFTVKRQRGQWQLKVGHYIGIVVLPSGMTLEILPKAIAAGTSSPAMQSYSEIIHTRYWVRNMLSDLTSNWHNNKPPHTKSLGQLSHQTASLALSALPLSSWLTTQFLQRLSAYQPTKQYQSQVHNQSSLQGRLLIKEQLQRNSTQPHKFFCEMSVLSQDMLCNRIIKSALELLMPLLYPSARSEAVSHKALITQQLSSWRQIRPLHYRERRQLAALYRQAKQQLVTQPLSQQQLRAAQYLLDLAYWLLQHSNAETGSALDTQRVASRHLSQPRLCLLLDMNQAFEQWASLCIAVTFNNASSDYRTSYQPQSVWLSDAAGQACLSIRPDILIHQNHDADDSATEDYNLTSGKVSDKVNASVSHVIDIKWKPLSHSAALSASDAYQLTSYAQAYHAKQVWLVYPVTDEYRRPVALSQQHIDGSGDAKPHSASAKLWLVPFNVLTGRLNIEACTDLQL